jgi:cytochrome c
VRSTSPLLLFAPLFLAILAASIDVHAEDAKPCRATSFSVSAVEQACKAGGQPAAKTLMKKAVDAAKASGAQVNCKSCHTDLTTFATTADAATELKRWL